MANNRVLVIGGSGFSSRLEQVGGKKDRIPTPFGQVDVLISAIAGKEVFAIRRHGEGHSLPPHMVDYQANIHLAKEVGACAILASTAVGTLRPGKFMPGDLVLCEDLIGLNLVLRGQPVTYFNTFADGPQHTDCTSPFDLRLNSILHDAGTKLGIAIKQDAVITLTYGPRYETRAEVRALATLGADLTGMTVVYEATFALELGVPYAVVAIVTNPGAGLGIKKLDHADVIEMMARKSEDVFSLIQAAIEKI